MDFFKVTFVLRMKCEFIELVCGSLHLNCGLMFSCDSQRTQLYFYYWNLNQYEIAIESIYIC